MGKSVPPPFTALTTPFVFVCEEFVGTNYKKKQVKNSNNALGLSFAYSWSMGEGRPAVFHSGSGATSKPLVFPPGIVVVEFSVTDTRSGCNSYITSMNVTVGPAAPSALEKLLQNTDDLKKQPLSTALQMVGVLSVAAQGGGGSSGNSSREQDAAAINLQMEQTAKLVGVLTSMISNLPASEITSEMAGQVLQALSQVSGGNSPTPLTTDASKELAATLLLLASTGKISIDQASNFAAASHNVIGSITGSTPSAEAGDPEVMKSVVTQVTDSIGSVLVNIAGSTNSSVPVRVASPDGSFQATAGNPKLVRQSEGDPATYDHASIFVNGNITFIIPVEWQQCASSGNTSGKEGTSNATDAASNGCAIFSSLGFASSPYKWASGSAEGNVGGLSLSGGSGGISVKNQTKCGEIRIKSDEPVAYFTSVLAVSKSKPITLSFNRSRSDLLKQLHFIVEPFHTAADGTSNEDSNGTKPETVGVLLRTTPELGNDELQAGSITSDQFNVSFASQSIRTAPKGAIVQSTAQPPKQQQRRWRRADTGTADKNGNMYTGTGHAVHPGHVLQLLPEHLSSSTCTMQNKRGGSGATHSISTDFDGDYATYTLVIQTNSTVSVNVHVRIFHTECVFLERNSSQWGSNDCLALPTTTPEHLQCSCNHLTSFGGRWKSAPVSPNLVKIRVITADDIGNNLVVFVPVVLLWMLFAAVMRWAFKAARRLAQTVTDKPQYIRRDLFSLQNNSYNGLKRYRMTLKTGTRPFSGLSKKNQVCIKLRTATDEDELRLDENASFSLARNTKSIFIFSTALDLEEIESVSVRVRGVEKQWFLVFMVLSDLEGVDAQATGDESGSKDRTRYFWFNLWIKTGEEKSASAQTFKAFNTFWNLFSYHFPESLTDKHVLASIFLFPPKSRFTPPQRVMVCMLLLSGLIFTNAFFYQDGQDRTLESTSFVALVSSLIVSVPVSAIVLLFRQAGNKGGTCSALWWTRMFAWVVGLGSCGWCSYYVLLLSFDWGPSVSWNWLTSVGTSFCISTLVAGPLYIAAMALIATQLYHIHDQTTLKKDLVAEVSAIAASDVDGSKFTRKAAGHTNESFGSDRFASSRSIVANQADGSDGLVRTRSVRNGGGDTRVVGHHKEDAWSGVFNVLVCNIFSIPAATSMQSMHDKGAFYAESQA